MSDDVIGGKPYRLATKLAKWENGRTPDDGEPDEVLHSATWYDGGGAEITDAARITELEMQYPQEVNPCH